MLHILSAIITLKYQCEWSRSGWPNADCRHNYLFRPQSSPKSSCGRIVLMIYTQSYTPTASQQMIIRYMANMRGIQIFLALIAIDDVKLRVRVGVGSFSQQYQYFHFL